MGRKEYSVWTYAGLPTVPLTPAPPSHTTYHHLVAVCSRFIHPYGFKDLLRPKATF